MEFIHFLYIIAGIAIGIANLVIYFKALRTFNNINDYFAKTNGKQMGVITKLHKTYYSPSANFELELYEAIYDSLRYGEYYNSNFKSWQKICNDNNWIFPKQFEDCIEWGDFKKKFLE